MLSMAFMFMKKAIALLLMPQVRVGTLTQIQNHTVCQAVAQTMRVICQTLKLMQAAMPFTQQSSAVLL
jgi:hypothetical protein